MNEEITKLKKTIERAEDNLFEGKIDATTFERRKARYTKRIADLEYEIADLQHSGL